MYGANPYQDNIQSRHAQVHGVIEMKNLLQKIKLIDLAVGVQTY